MRGLVWSVLGIGMMFAASPASAQTYDPNYPVCMEAYGSDGSHIECYFTSMAQCKEGTVGFPGVCFNNPYYKAPPVELGSRGTNGTRTPRDPGEITATLSAPARAGNGVVVRSSF